MCTLHVLSCSNCVGVATIMEYVESCSLYYVAGNYCLEVDYQVMYYQCQSCQTPSSTI